MKITGTELQERAKAAHENPYYLAYALATGCATADEAWARDKSALPFAQWMGDRWLEAAIKHNINGENRHDMISWTACSISQDEICAVLADHVTAATEQKGD